MLNLFNGTKLKSLVKTNRLFYHLNATFKAHRSRQFIRSQDNYYRNEIITRGIHYDLEIIRQELRSKLLTREALHPKPLGRLRIFWLGGNEDQDRSGFLQALNTFGEVIEFRNSKGTYGLEYSGSVFYDPSVAQRNSEALERQFFEEHKKKKVDLLIGQFGANFLNVGILDLIKKSKCVVINIAMDDRLPELWTSIQGRLMGSVGLAGAVDLTLNTCEEFCPRYLCHGGFAIPWVLGSDPDIFRPAATKLYDISFVGSNYGVRPVYINRMRASGLNVSTFGPGWPSGLINAQKTAEVFGQSKIVLGMGTVGYHNDLYTIKLRDFDATMAGALYITHGHPDLAKLFNENEEIVFYSTLDEAVKKIRFYLKNESRCLQIGQQAAKKARAQYTWKMRIHEALNFVGLLEDSQNVRN
jgi:hypothetical protein